MRIVIWSVFESSHLADLTCNLAISGHEVTHFFNENVPSFRKGMGWTSPNRGRVNTHQLGIESLDEVFRNGFGDGAIHLVHGIRGVHFITNVARRLHKCNAIWGTMFENVDERHGMSHIKKVLYALKLNSLNPNYILGLGHKVPQWVQNLGYPANRVFPFAYFIDPSWERNATTRVHNDKFVVGYVGQFIRLKRIDILVDALAGLERGSFRLVLVGGGVMRKTIIQRAHDKLGSENVEFLDYMPISEVRKFMSTFDCFVLPSEQDGWGAVVVEALMNGVPSICSDACGVVTAVKASGCGGVFINRSVSDLREKLEIAIPKGKPDDAYKSQLSTWAGNVFSGKAGSEYLTKIFEHLLYQHPRPDAPWIATPAPRNTSNPSA